MEETRWLDSTEQDAWRSFVFATLSLWEVLDRQLQRDHGLNHAYYAVLICLSEAPGRQLRMSELADFVRSSRSRLSHAVSRLEERGYVERLPCPTDRRGQVARLTDAGMAATVEIAPGHVDTVRANVIDVLTPEQLASLHEICDAIHAATEKTVANEPG